MQLKVKRDQRSDGLVFKSATYILSVVCEFTPEEEQTIKKNKLGNEVLLRDPTSKDIRYAKSGFAKAAKLLTTDAGDWISITPTDLRAGLVFEAKDQFDLNAFEGRVKNACGTLNAMLMKSGSFEGSEEVVDFGDGPPKVVARAQPLADDAN